MTSFVNVEYPSQHAGVARVERAISAIASFTRGFEGGRGAATLLLAAMVSALLVVANQVIETWSEGHLLAAWIAMWTVAFAAIALLAAPARTLVRRFRQGAAARRQAGEDRAFWAAAVNDARVMADLSRAMSADAMRDVRAYY
jgi:hypothetical protein